MNPEPYACTAPDCPGRILFPASVKTGKRGPVDADPVPLGNIELDWDAGTYHVLTGAALHGAQDAGALLYVSHYATCTDPAAFRAGLRYRTARPAGTTRPATRPEETPAAPGTPAP
jgi:hypothetical protein